MRYISLSFLLILLVSCNSSPDLIKIGWIGPLSGDAASIGIPNLRGSELAIDKINSAGGIDGKQITLIAEDDGLEATRTVSAFNKLVDVDGVEAVIAISYGGFLSIAPLAEQKQVVLIDSLDSSDELGRAGDWAFGIGIYDEGIGIRLADFLAGTLGKKKIGALYFKGDPFFPLLVDGLRRRAVEQGAEVIAEGYGADETDFRSILSKMGDVEALGALGYDESGLILKQAQEWKLNATFFGADTITSKGFSDNAGPAMEGLYFTSWDSEDAGVTALKQAHQSRYQEPAENILFTVVGYDAMNALAHTMQGGVRGVDLKNRLYHLKDYPGLSGSLTMSEDGMVRTMEEQIFQVKNGDFVRVEE